MVVVAKIIVVVIVVVVAVLAGWMHGYGEVEHVLVHGLCCTHTYTHAEQTGAMAGTQQAGAGGGQHTRSTRDSHAKQHVCVARFHWPPCVFGAVLAWLFPCCATTAHTRAQNTAGRCGRHMLYGALGFQKPPSFQAHHPLLCVRVV